MLGNTKYRTADTKTIKISLIDHHKYISLVLMLYTNTNLLLLPKSARTRNTIATINKLFVVTCLNLPTYPEF